MKIAIKSELVYSFAPSTQIIASLEASHTDDQTIVSEKLVFDPPAELLRDISPAGDRSIRACLSGEVAIRYDAVVENRLRQLLPASGQQHVWSELPHDVLPFLLPSRFCPSDKFMRFAQREFASAGDGVARVMAILNWISRNIDYVAGVSDAETTAERTFVDRAGVCRDFTHLGITLTRALGIPARAVSAYALDLNPPDFHAVFEVYLDNSWWLIDPTRLAPVAGIVRIGNGRDASDIAFLTSDKQCQVLRQSISVTAAA
ncbi:MULTISPECIES: transglutaminase family protein [Rhodopseudomonas]|uniref:Transglutaminase n=1 Tax=Rhodopseudomonas palustris TaxID=1076 RepID=A0A0D7EKC5_RHOPL|nr:MULTISPECIES: transglutaminase family protein [Rhodopseudomonas]KIZ41279.1 transglutaminase [Rhodopseudomonas palustris]MDF3810601.1 transglutaminase family protein [Rhodopseudomonas sp. BAL398]WOK16502.1 transglutaminase family protein [Rhodopseudomonas sp. BAL398]